MFIAPVTRGEPHSGGFLNERRIIMKNYESPVIFDNEELAEGVYATGSGGGAGATCWTVCVDSTGHQENAGSPDGQSPTYSVTQIKADHHMDVIHDSIGLTFEGDATPTEPGDYVTDIRSEDPNTFSIIYNGGGHFICTRNRYADAFGSGDTCTFKIKVYSSSASVSKPPMVTNVYNPQCNYRENWMGGGDGN